MRWETAKGYKGEDESCRGSANVSSPVNFACQSTRPLPTEYVPVAHPPTPPQTEQVFAFAAVRLLPASLDSAVVVPR